MLDHKIELIHIEIQNAKGHLTDIKAAMQQLEQAGMYNAIPHFQWQDRNGKGDYLYLIFRQNNDGTYQGPDGKRKVYVGADEKRIKEAKRMVANREQWQVYERNARDLDLWIRARESDLRQLVNQVDRLLQTAQKLPYVELPQPETKVTLVMNGHAFPIRAAS